MTKKTYKLLSYAELSLYILLIVLSLLQKDYMLSLLWIIVIALQIVEMCHSKVNKGKYNE